MGTHNVQNVTVMIGNFESMTVQRIHLCVHVSLWWSAALLSYHQINSMLRGPESHRSDKDPLVDTVSLEVFIWTHTLVAIEERNSEVNVAFCYLQCQGPIASWEGWKRRGDPVGRFWSLWWARGTVTCSICMAAILTGPGCLFFFLSSLSNSILRFYKRFYFYCQGHLDVL